LHIAGVHGNTFFRLDLMRPCACAFFLCLKQLFCSTVIFEGKIATFLTFLSVGGGTSAQW